MALSKKGDKADIWAPDQKWSGFLFCVFMR